MMEAAVVEAVVEVRGWRWRANLAAAKVARRIMERERSYLVRVYLFVRIVLAACWYDRERCLRWKYIVLRSVLVIQKDTRRETCGGERIERRRKNNFERWRGRYIKVTSVPAWCRHLSRPLVYTFKAGWLRFIGSPQALGSSGSRRGNIVDWGCSVKYVPQGQFDPVRL